MKQKLFLLINAYLPPILWAALIYILSGQSSLPGFEVSAYDFFFKKCAHIFVYAVLYVLLFRAVNYQQTSKNKNWIFPFLLCFLYAALDEIHQSFTPNRSPTLRDIGFDMLGAGVAFLKIHKYI